MIKQRRNDKQTQKETRRTDAVIDNVEVFRQPVKPVRQIPKTNKNIAVKVKNEMSQ